MCSDKTGTLTLGKMQMQEIIVYEYEDEVADSAHQGKREPHTPQDILKYACLAAKWWEPAKDAIDRLVLGRDAKGHVVKASILDYKSGGVSDPEALEAIYGDQMHRYAQGVAATWGLSVEDIDTQLIHVA